MIAAEVLVSEQGEMKIHEMRSSSHRISLASLIMVAKDHSNVSEVLVIVTVTSTNWYTYQVHTTVTCSDSR